MRTFTNRRLPQLGAMAMATAALGLGLGACGDDEDSGGGGGAEGEAKQVAETWIQGMANRDAAKVCSTLPKALTESKEAKQAGGCEKGIATQLKATNDEALKTIKEADVKEASVDGDKATVKVESDGKTDDLRLVKEGEEWKIDTGAGGG